MVKKWSEEELKKELSKLTIIVDSREKVNQHILDYFDKNKIIYKVRTLETGDYSATINGMTLEYDFLIERKASLTELCGNFTASRERFEREFLRAKALGTKVFLIVENANWADVYLGNYRSKLSAKSLVASLMAWQVRFNITIIFCAPENTGKIIFHLLYYAAREQLLNGK